MLLVLFLVEEEVVLGRIIRPDVFDGLVDLAFLQELQQKNIANVYQTSGNFFMLLQRQPGDTYFIPLTNKVTETICLGL